MVLGLVWVSLSVRIVGNRTIQPLGIDHIQPGILCYILHKSEYYREKLWCCKANNKLIPPRLATKDGKPCPHFFKYVNCKGDYQADSNKCPYWQNYFNKKWHDRK